PGGDPSHVGLVPAKRMLPEEVGDAESALRLAEEQDVGAAAAGIAELEGQADARAHRDVRRDEGADLRPRLERRDRRRPAAAAPARRRADGERAAQREVAGRAAVKVIPAARAEADRRDAIAGAVRVAGEVEQ